MPYRCKDGRELESHDFVKTRKGIDDFLAMVEQHCSTFFSHHDRAKWQDEDSGGLAALVSLIVDLLHQLCRLSPEEHTQDWHYSKL